MPLLAYIDRTGKRISDVAGEILFCGYNDFFFQVLCYYRKFILIICFPFKFEYLYHEVS